MESLDKFSEFQTLHRIHKQVKQVVLMLGSWSWIQVLTFAPVDRDGAGIKSCKVPKGIFEI